MANVLGTLFQDIANAIRGKTGEEGALKPNQFADAIASITVGEGGGSSEDVRYVTFVNPVNGEQFVRAVLAGNDCMDVVAKGLWSKPTKDSDSSACYEYCGWSDSPNGAADNQILRNITENKVVYAVFTAYPVLSTAECGPATHWCLYTNGLLQVFGEGEISAVEALFNSTNKTFGTYGETHVKRVVINPGITIIGNYFFQNCKVLETVSLPDTLQEIRGYSFWGCVSLKRFDVPNSVHTIGNWFLQGCDALEEVTLPDTLTELPERTFWNSTALKHFRIPAAVTKIGWFQLVGTSVESVIFPDPYGWWSGGKTATSGDPVDPAILADPALAAEAMKTTYAQLWLRKGERS